MSPPKINRKGDSPNARREKVIVDMEPEIPSPHYSITGSPNRIPKHPTVEIGELCAMTSSHTDTPLIVSPSRITEESMLIQDLFTI